VHYTWLKQFDRSPNFLRQRIVFLLSFSVKNYRVREMSTTFRWSAHSSSQSSTSVVRCWLVYLSETLHLSTEVDARRRLRSASTSTLIVPSTRRSTVGDRAYPVAAARVWNSLPDSVRSTSSLASFCHFFTDTQRYLRT